MLSQKQTIGNRSSIQPTSNIKNLTHFIRTYMSETAMLFSLKRACVFNNSAQKPFSCHNLANFCCIYIGIAKLYLKLD